VAPQLDKRRAGAKNRPMNEQPTANLVVFCSSPPLAIDQSYPDAKRLLAMAPEVADYDKLDSFLKPFERDFVKLGQGTFVLDEDRCHPALLQMIQHCHQQKYRFAVFPLGADVVSLSPPCQDLQAWLAERGRPFRWTSLPASEPGK
jgi:hypothetical protein